MDRDEQEDTTIYKVVVSHEEQYSIWPAYRENPHGWKDVGKSGPKTECLAYIEEVWTDMRPLSHRRQMEEASQRRILSEAIVPSRSEPSPKPEQTNLVQRLSEGEHSVEVSLHPEKSVQVFKGCLDRGYVYIKFTNTRGGTELGVRIDREATDVSQADIDNQIGNVHLVRELMLNYVKVRCIANIDLTTFTGHGHLEPLNN